MLACVTIGRPSPFGAFFTTQNQDVDHTTATNLTGGFGIACVWRERGMAARLGVLEVLDHDHLGAELAEDLPGEGALPTAKVEDYMPGQDLRLFHVFFLIAHGLGVGPSGPGTSPRGD